MTTFEQIYYRGQLITENDLYKQLHTPEMLLFYDGNFLQFKRMPSVSEWEEAVDYLRQFHLKNGQEHIKVLFPENVVLPKNLKEHITELGYELGLMEQYAIKPECFPSVKEDSRIVIEVATEENLEEMLRLKFDIDAEISQEFAEQKRAIHEENFRSDQFLQLIAFYEGKPAGTVDIIIGENTAEIDGLVVLEAFRKKGIGSHLQQFVMKEFPDKTIILVADGEDTPKEMYKKQNYQQQGFKYEALKVFSN